MKQKIKEIRGKLNNAEANVQYEPLYYSLEIALDALEKYGDKETNFIRQFTNDENLLNEAGKAVSQISVAQNAINKIHKELGLSDDN